MNHERLRQVADAIEAAPPEQFNMEKWCGTACCIAGWACKVAGKQPRHVSMVAQDWLELTDEQAEHLFLGYWAKEDLAHITSDAAVAYLRSLAGGGA